MLKLESVQPSNLPPKKKQHTQRELENLSEFYKKQVDVQVYIALTLHKQPFHAKRKV